MSKAALSRAVTVSGATVTDWESGVIKKIDGENLLKVCQVLGVSPGWLLTGRGSPDSATPLPAPALSPEDAALLDDLTELLPEDAASYRAAIRADADKARRYRGKPTAARLLSAPPAGETADLIKKKDMA